MSSGIRATSGQFADIRFHSLAERMLFMVVEHFRGGDAKPVYARFRECGRLAPAGLSYVTSWVTDDLARCYQVMDSPTRELVDEWIAAWQDLVEFEVHPVVTSAEAAARVPVP